MSRVMASLMLKLMTWGMIAVTATGRDRRVIGSEAAQRNRSAAAVDANTGLEPVSTTPLPDNIEILAMATAASNLTSIEREHAHQHGAATARDPRLRFVTAASLFDGHDASINIMRRILQAEGTEVIHLGHNRSVHDVVTAAIHEDAHAIAVSSYQGGHVEYFKYMLDMLRERGRGDMKVFGGGGGVIVPEEINELHEYGIARIYSPQDGQKMGLKGMIADMRARCEPNLGSQLPTDLSQLSVLDYTHLSRLITAVESGVLSDDLCAQIDSAYEGLANAQALPPVVGITGTGGAGKSSLTDELVRRLRLDQSDRLKIALLAVDPTRRRTGGALLGDRIRMNAIDHPNVYMRSLATRGAAAELPDYLDRVIRLTRLAGFDLVIVETPGIGQGDAGVVPFVDVPIYVMTPEFGAASQLEKIARAPRMRCAMCASNYNAIVKLSRNHPSRCRSTAPLRRALMTTVSAPCITA